MQKSSIIVMETSCPTNCFKNNVAVLLNVSLNELSDYSPISSEMRDNKQEVIKLIKAAKVLLTEYD